jgi:hypothetical protein
VKIVNRLTSYPPTLPLDPSTSVDWKTFHCSILCRYTESINHIPSPQSLSFTLPLLVSPHALCSHVFHYFLSQCIQRGISRTPAVSILYFDSLNPFHSSPTPIIQKLSIHIVVSSSFTYVVFYKIVDALSFSSPFPSPIFSFHFFFFTLPVYSKPLPCQWGCRMTSRMSWPWVPQPCFLNSALGFSASSSSYCVSLHWLSLLLKMISYHLYVELIKSCTNHTSRIIVTSSYPNISNTIKHSSSLLPWNSVCHTEFLLFCIAVLLGCTYALL